MNIGEVLEQSVRNIMEILSSVFDGVNVSLRIISNKELMVKESKVLEVLFLPIGEYYVSVKFNDDHIPDSPYRVSITPSIGDARKLSVQSLQDRGLQVSLFLSLLDENE